MMMRSVVASPRIFIALLLATPRLRYFSPGICFTPPLPIFLRCRAAPYARRLTLPPVIFVSGSALPDSHDTRHRLPPSLPATAARRFDIDMSDDISLRRRSSPENRPRSVGDYFPPAIRHLKEMMFSPPAHYRLPAMPP